MRVVHDLRDKGRRYQLDGLERIGAGGQAEAWRVRKRDGRLVHEVLKMYRTGPESREGRHLLRFVAAVENLRSPVDTVTICTPFAAVVDPKSKLVGCLMPEGVGVELDDKLYDGLFDDKDSLLTRLRVAERISAAIASLHRRNIVHADLTEQNVLVDQNLHSVSLIDLDGGGVLDSVVDGTFHPELAPLVTGKQEGSFMAPELVDSQLSPSLNSDAWSLAVLLHYVIFDGLDPFFQADTYREVIQAAQPWPPQDVKVDRHTWAQFHASELNRLGPTIRGHFKKALSPGHGGTWAFAPRPSAADWHRALHEAADWVQQCDGCSSDQSIVTLRQHTCPYCGGLIRHAVAYLPTGPVNLDSSSRTLLGRDLGFDDGGELYEALTISRSGSQFVLKPKVPLREVATGRTLAPSGEVLRVGPGNHELIAWAKGSWRHRYFSLVVPRWGTGQ